jgi:hypothetical protein
LGKTLHAITVIPRPLVPLKKTLFSHNGTKITAHKPIFSLFHKTPCPPCRREIPFFQSSTNRYPSLLLCHPSSAECFPCEAPPSISLKG